MNKNKQEILRAFLSKQFSDLDEEVILVLDAVVSLEKGDGNEAEETRVITIEDQDGKISARSLNIYNLMRISFQDMVEILFEGADLLSEDNKIMVIMALLNIVYEFVPNLSYTFNEEEAKILVIIWHQKGKEVTATELARAYKQKFVEDIDTDLITYYLKSFHKFKVLKYKGDGKYQARERMTYERN